MKEIFIGEIEESLTGTPIERFKKAFEIYKDDFKVYTNDVLFLETLEVLCGEDNINVYLCLNDKYEEITCMEAYEYVGDIYSILNRIRFSKELKQDLGEFTEFNINSIKLEIKDYEKKFNELIGQLVKLYNKRFYIDKTGSTGWWILIDKEGKSFDGMLYLQDVMEDLCDLLNQLNDENDN